jgi:transcriptional regulator with PAS, ATPase and Fis domain
MGVHLGSEFEQDVTKRVPASERGLRTSSADLVVVSGPDRGLRVPFRSGVARVGTAQGLELRLSDPTVSRFHCELRLEGAKVRVKDTGSTNGTWVGATELREGLIEAGTPVRVGTTALRIELKDEPSFIPLSDRSEFFGLLGASVEMRQVFAVLERVAATDSTVLLEGETGTGKDLAAQAIHRASRRASGPFVPVDCSAIPESLFESELFGHTRGAFSGAVADRIGVLEEAAQGTLFLDEIGELPLALQPKLLRALEGREVRPVGSNTARPIDVRVLAATHRPLARCVNEGTFREDLYYRLAVVELLLPPLRERSEDLPALATHFYRKMTGRDDPPPAAFLERLMARSWPGNVRELRNSIERGVALGMLDEPVRSEEAVERSPTGARVPLELPLKDARDAWMDQFETVYVSAMLERTGGNLTRAAELAGVSRRFLQRLIARKKR